MEKIVRPESMERITTPALAQKFIEEQIAEIRAQVGSKKVLLALSGGVDSSVLAALLAEAVGGLSGWLTRDGAAAFNETVIQPPLSPPAWTP